MTEIDLTPWGDYLRAFTAMQRSLADGDPITAQFKRREMLALINASPDYWRGVALRARDRTRKAPRVPRNRHPDPDLRQIADTPHATHRRSRRH